MPGRHVLVPDASSLPGGVDRSYVLDLGRTERQGVVRCAHAGVGHRLSVAARDRVAWPARGGYGPWQRVWT